MVKLNTLEQNVSVFCLCNSGTIKKYKKSQFAKVSWSTALKYVIGSCAINHVHRWCFLQIDSFKTGINSVPLSQPMTYVFDSQKPAHYDSTLAISWRWILAVVSDHSINLAFKNILSGLLNFLFGHSHNFSLALFHYRTWRAYILALYRHSLTFKVTHATRLLHNKHRVLWCHFLLNINTVCWAA